MLSVLQNLQHARGISIGASGGDATGAMPPGGTTGARAKTLPGGGSTGQVNTPKSTGGRAAYGQSSGGTGE